MHRTKIIGLTILQANQESNFVFTFIHVCEGKSDHSVTVYTEIKLKPSKFTSCFYLMIEAKRIYLWFPFINLKDYNMACT